MPTVRDHTQAAPPGVAFEVERVGWPSPDRVEVVGRWYGVRGRRFIRPTLAVEVDGERRRMLAVLDHKPWAVEDGQDWIAAFAWEGEPTDLSGSELTVGPNVAVELLAPGEKRQPEKQIARRPRSDVLEDELAAVRAKSQRLTRELHAARAEHSAEMARTAVEHEAELERVRSERATAAKDLEHRSAELRGELDAARDKLMRLETALQKARDELAVARADAAELREGLERERAGIAEEASRTAAEEAERLRTERDEARRLSATARGERDAAVRERDQARQERKAVLSSVRTEGEKRRGVQTSAPREPTPTLPAPPVAEPVIIRPAGPGALGDEPPRLRARVAAIAALLLLILVLVLLLL
jgi:hypothetical protein